MKILAKLFFVLAFGAVVSLATLHYSKTPTDTPSSVKTTIKKVNEVELATVIEKISTKAELVGLSTPIMKGYTYSDPNFFGDKSISVVLHGNIKMGFDIQEVLKGVSVSGNTVRVVLPQPILISFEAPFNEAEIKPHVDLLRRAFTVQDAQLIYEKVASKAKEEIMNNPALAAEASKRTRGILEQMLKTVSNVQMVEFTS